MRLNRMKQKLREGQPVIGCAVTLPEPFICEAMGRAGFDFLLVEMEHSPLTISELQAMMIALNPTESTVIARTPWNDPVWVKQILDVGVEGIIFPWINSRAECEAAVAATKYPPEGIRGIGPRRAARFAESLEDYLAHANDNVLVLPQIERIEAVERLDEILTTPGLDGIMVGPADLAASMGLRNDLGSPAVDDAVRRILDGCLRHGVPFGMFTGTAGQAAAWIDAGGKIATVGADFVWIDEGIARTQAEIAGILAR